MILRQIRLYYWPPQKVLNNFTHLSNSNLNVVCVRIIQSVNEENMKCYVDIFIIQLTNNVGHEPKVTTKEKIIPG